MRSTRLLAAAMLACASASGWALPELDEAKRLYERGHYAAAYKKLLFPAEVGEPEAQELLGFMYALGPEVYPGVPHDPAMAAVWLGRAALNGRPAAQHMYCAVVRRAQPARKIGLLHCFDEFADSAATPADAGPVRVRKKSPQRR